MLRRRVHSLIQRINSSRDSLGIVFLRAIFSVAHSLLEEASELHEIGFGVAYVECLRLDHDFPLDSL